MLSRGWWLSYNYLAAPRAVHFLTKSTHFALLLKQLYHSFPPLSIDDGGYYMQEEREEAYTSF